jgi:hydroxyacylglutathione hydrolase
MILDRIFTPGLAQVAYLVADEAAGEVAVIDPRRDTQVYIEWAEARGLRITAILETHVHADFVSGALELAQVTGATIYSSRLGEQEFEHHPIDDGDEIKVGALVLRALFTPGHTPEHMAYLLIDPAQGPDPIALYSGDVLFVGEVGRPDLLGKERTLKLAEQLYETVSDRLSVLDDRVIVYPGHTAGSACGKKIGDAPSTTMGQEKRFNYAFQATSRDSFIDTVMAGMPTPPAYYPVLKKVNKVGATLVSELPAPASMTPEQLTDAITNGALLVDTRTQEAFAEGHIPGAVFAGLGTNFTAWMGWIAPYEQDLVLVLEDEQALDEAMTELRRIGLDRVSGYLAGGMSAWRAAGREVTSVPVMTVTELSQRLLNDDDRLTVLDVRSPEEWNENRIAGAVNFYAGKIARGEEPELSRDRDLAVICGSGYRSVVSISLLRKAGFTNLINVIGGMEAWDAANMPTAQRELLEV